MIQNFHSYYKKNQDWRINTFKDHVATLITYASIEAPDLLEIRFRKPKSYDGYISYLLMRNTLFVSGDYGEAVYVWSSLITPAFVAGCDYSYFSGKCEASEYENCEKTFDEEVYEQSLKDYLQTIIDEKASKLASAEEEVFNEEKDEYIYPLALKARSEEEKTRLRSLAKKFLMEEYNRIGNWIAVDCLEEKNFLCQYTGNGKYSLWEFMNDNPFQTDCVYECVSGEAIGERVLLHHLGFQLAYKQLKESGCFEKTVTA